MAGESRLPGHGDLVIELRLIRERGQTELRRLDLPLLAQVAEDTGLSSSSEVEPAAISELLRGAVDTLDGGRAQEAAEYTFGLAQGTRLWSPQARRQEAAQVYGITAESFRKDPERQLIEQVAEGVLAVLRQTRLRQARLNMERRHPADSRLAVQWVERFEAYNRMWTPVYALAADLTAYRSTLLEPDRPYDREPGTLGPDDKGYTQERQAEGYATFALYRYARFMWELHAFIRRHGGLWLLSTSEAETVVSDAVYRVGWHVSPYNARDESWLRRSVGESRGEEMDGFLHVLTSTSTGMARHAEWQEWAATCDCVWDMKCGNEEHEHFPTGRHHSNIDESCQMHQVIAACNSYCDIIDDEWTKIADWYHLDDRARRGVSPGRLYGEWRRTPGGSEWRPS